MSKDIHSPKNNKYDFIPKKYGAKIQIIMIISSMNHDYF